MGLYSYFLGGIMMVFVFVWLVVVIVLCSVLLVVDLFCVIVLKLWILNFLVWLKLGIVIFGIVKGVFILMVFVVGSEVCLGNCFIVEYFDKVV